MNHIIDATDKTLGRLSSEIAVLIRGKNNANFERHIDGGATVKVVNISKVKVTGNKLNDKVYHRHSGYPGGQKTENLAKVIEKKGYKEALIRAVKGMLPANKLRDRMLKRINITD